MNVDVSITFMLSASLSYFPFLVCDASVSGYPPSLAYRRGFGLDCVSWIALDRNEHAGVHRHIDPHHFPLAQSRYVRLLILTALSTPYPAGWSRLFSRLWLLLIAYPSTYLSLDSSAFHW